MNRQEYQLAIDIIKAINVANDLFDEASKIIKKPENVLYASPSTTPGDSPVILELTDDEKKDRLNLFITRATDNIMNYVNNANSSLSGSWRGEIVSGLSSLGINVEDIEADIIKYSSVCAELKKRVETNKNISEVQSDASYIDGQIAKLKLVRKV